MSQALTNSVRGHGVDRGRQSAKDVERLHGSKPIAVENIDEPCMVFFINKTYSPTKNEIQLYDCTRQFWHKVAKKTRIRKNKTEGLHYETALAIVDSVVVRVYTIVDWFPAGTTHSTREAHDLTDKWEFVGQLNAQHDLVGRRLTKGGVDLKANQCGFGYYR